MSDHDDKRQEDRVDGSSASLTEKGLGGGSSLTSMMHTGLGIESPFMREIYLKRQCIVGTRYVGGSDELVEDLKEGSRITFLRESDNQFDSNAIMALDEQGRKLGYIPKRENELMAALMGAGKYFYGIITDPPKPNEYTGNKTPFSIWMDLYMREFARPGDLSEIPLQGYKGSFVVADLTFARSAEGLFISEIYGIKIIRGEERSAFDMSLYDNAQNGCEADVGEYVLAEDGSSDMQSKPDLDDKALKDLGRMIRAFIRFAGHLPIVTFNILGRRQECLEETFDMAAGTTFSNHVIDTRQMAQNHIPGANSDSLQSLADYLGIDAPCQDPREKRCRIIWQLYCRMERSELDKKKDQEMNPEAGLAN